MSEAHSIPTQHLDALRPLLAAEDSGYAAEVRYHTERFLESPRGENEPSPALRPPSIERFARVVKEEREQLEQMQEHGGAAVNHVDRIANNDTNSAHLYVTSVELVSLHNRIAKLKQLPPSTRHNLQRCLMRLTYWCDWTFWNTLDQWFVEQGMQRVTDLESLILLDLHASPPSLPVDTAFVAHRRAKNKDRLGALRPDDLPSGWESLDFPAQWDVIGLRKWIEYSRTKLLDQPTLPESNELALLAGEVYLTRVADSHRAARRLADQRGWSDPPTPSDSQLVLAIGELESILNSLNYLKVLEEWIDNGVTGANQEQPGKREPPGAPKYSEDGAQAQLDGGAGMLYDLNGRLAAPDEVNGDEQAEAAKLATPINKSGQQADSREESSSEALKTSSNEKAAPIKCPPDKAFQAYRLSVLKGWNQTQIAEELVTNQGQVSRWIKDAKEYINAGNVLPDLEVMNKPQSIDPTVIDMGARSDGRAPRQREKRSDDSGD